MKKNFESLYETLGGTYREENGHLIPDIALPEHTDYQIGKYGRMHLDYIKSHRRGRYTTLLTEGKLNVRLHEIDLEANELLETIILRLAAERDIDENLKARDMLRWVAEMNNIKAIRKRSSCGRWCLYEVDHQRTLARKHHPARK